jgi:hypothetical protein
MTTVVSQFCQEQGALKEFMVWKLGLTENLKCLKWDLKCKIYFEFDILWLNGKKFINSCKGVLVQSDLGIGIPWEFWMFEVRFERSNLFQIQYTLVHWKEFINPSKFVFVQFKIELDLDHPREVSSWWR